MICPKCGFDDEGVIGKTLEATDEKTQLALVELNANGIKMLRHQAHERQEAADNLITIAKGLKSVVPLKTSELN